ncbi:MAG: LuxR C-terminal-related transcriptional regulator, partial [Bacteroidota bacterium]|nr:LuxR C-terminal-related transcriptional regulator [Bacteroidota bacterium]
KSVLFIANNTDTVQFPTSFEEQSLCTITSTNPKSSVLLEWEGLKEQMAYDFVDYPSEASKKLNMKKWFSDLQRFGAKANEPLVELLIYDFLSDKRNETYSHYLEDIGSNPYYEELSSRLQQTYPNAGFTQEYEAEISTDKELANFNQPKIAKFLWVVLSVLALSLLGNLYFFVNRRAKLKSKSDDLLQKLTPQEQKIVHYILLDKSNKEIASALFVSLSTVKTHINNLYKKLDISSREEIVLLFNK